MIWISQGVRNSCYESSVLSHPKGAPMDSNLVTGETTDEHWAHCHFSFRWLVVCDMVHYNAGSSHCKMHVVNNTVAFKKCLTGMRARMCQEKTFPIPLHHHHPLPELLAGWVHEIILLMSNSDPTICMSHQKSRFIRPGNIFGKFSCPVSVSLCSQ